MAWLGRVGREGNALSGWQGSLYVGPCRRSDAEMKPPASGSPYVSPEASHPVGLWFDFSCHNKLNSESRSLLRMFSTRQVGRARLPLLRTQKLSWLNGFTMFGGGRALHVRLKQVDVPLAPSQMEFGTSRLHLKRSIGRLDLLPARAAQGGQTSWCCDPCI